MRSRAQVKSHPIHPMLVAFPIGLWIGGFLMDLIGRAASNSSLWTAGWYATLGGCIGAALAAIPGAIDLLSVVPPRSSAKKRGFTHAILNVCVLGVFIAVLAIRGDAGTQPTGTTLLLGVIGIAVLGYSGWLGGTLVYRNQIGVDHRYANAGQWKERTISGWDQPACNEAELGMGQMMLVHVGNNRVVVGKCAEGIVAFSDHCTHKGGPLSDGVLSGCTVQCPWHGSQFDVHTGRVIAGPAGSKIDTFEIRVSGQEVYIRPRTEVERKVA